MPLEIIEVDDSNVQQTAGRIPVMGFMFVAFLADWCGHCQRFKPEWTKTKHQLKKHKKGRGTIITVDDKNMKNLGIQQPDGFPSMKLYKGGDYVKDYTGGRSVNEIINFLKPYMGLGVMQGGKRKTRKRRRKRKVSKNKRSRIKHKRRRKSRRRRRRSQHRRPHRRAAPSEMKNVS